MSINYTLKSSPGFTLIEMAVVIMILGLVIAGFSQPYKMYLEHKASHDTQVKIDDITAAIGTFRAVNGRYPCPASLTARPGDANYGLENCGPLPIALGTCSTGAGTPGLCRERSERTTRQTAAGTVDFTYRNPYAAGNPVITVTNPALAPPVRVGTIPFRDLNLDEDTAFDGYNNRIKYAVTEHLMFSNTFRADEGGIEIVDNAATPRSLLNPPASSHFLVFSHGKNGSGAFTRDGARLPCVANNAESANCDVSQTARYVNTITSTAQNNSQFDDNLSYSTESELPLWQPSTVPLHELDIVQKPDGDVGMLFGAASQEFNSTTTNSSKDALINGTLRATNLTPADPDAGGNVMSNSFCAQDPNSSKCFETSLLHDGELKCPNAKYPTGKYMKAIVDGQAVCGDGEIKCDNGSIMTGIDNNGNIICLSNLACKSGKYSLCPNLADATLPGGAEGTKTTAYSNAYWTKIETLKCVGTSWVPQGDEKGLCECKPETQATTQKAGCGTGFTGPSFQQTRKVTCPSKGATGNGYIYSAWEPAKTVKNGLTYPPVPGCKCTPFTDDKSTKCTNTKYSPTIKKQTRNWVCSGNGGKFTDYTPPQSEIDKGCKCQAKGDITSSVSCGPNYAPGLNKKVIKKFNLQTCDYGPAQDLDTSKCICKEWKEKVTRKCPKDQVGTGLVYEISYKCSPYRTEEKLVSSDCKPAQPVSCTWQAQQSNSSPNPTGKKIGSPCECGKDKATTCYSGYTGNWRTYQNCQCGAGN